MYTDITALSHQTIVARAGSNVNLSCPGINELSLISVLEWKCHGCNLAPNSNNGNSSSSSRSSSSGGGGVSSTNGGSEKDQIKLVEYTNNAVVVWHNQERLSLDLQTYNLQLAPVRQWDHGEYICLANDRRRPDAVIHLIVHGKRLSGPLSRRRSIRFRANQNPLQRHLSV